MKNLIISLFLLFATSLYGADITNGVFYVDTPVGSTLITQNKGSTTNFLGAGRTYSVGNAVMEVKTDKTTQLFFSGGPLIQIGANSEFTILLFDQAVDNLSASPQYAKFGSHMVNLSFTKGEFIVIYPNKDENSRVTVNTQYADYELTGGKYLFRVSDKSVVVFVLEGNVLVHSDKSRVETVSKGNLAFAVPFPDVVNGVNDKIVSSIRRSNPDEIDKFAFPISSVEKNLNNIGFFVIDGKVVGVLLK
jgi:hypothetical protein